MSGPIAKGTGKPLGASYWKEIAGRGPRRMDAEIQSLLICPDDDAPLEFPEDGGDPVCPHCGRSFSRGRGFLEALPSKDIYALQPDQIARLEARNPEPEITADPSTLYGPLWERLLSLTGDLKGKLVLDACCGTGYIARWMAERGAKVVALDVATGPAGLGALTRTDKQENMTLELVLADVCRIPFQSASFHYVILSDAIGCQPRPERLLREASRVLRDGGLIFSLGDKFEGSEKMHLAGGDPRREGRLLSLGDFRGIFGEGDLEMQCHVATVDPIHPKAGFFARWMHARKVISAPGPKLLVGTHQKSFEISFSRGEKQTD